MMNDSIFIKGAIPNEKIMAAMTSIAKDGHIGAQSVFMGHIRQDTVENKEVFAIDYSAYEPMAIKAFNTLIEQAKNDYKLKEVIVYHSLGQVKVGEASLLIITLSKHRRSSLDGLNWLVEAIKNDVPIFGKELFANCHYQWKENKY